METLIYRVSKETTESVLSEIANIVYQQWPDTYQNEKVLALEELKTCQKQYKKGLPQCFYALKDKKEVIGVAYLLDQDTDFFTEETPWLANVFVKPQFRNNGLGKKLVTTVIEAAKVLGSANLYLHTVDKQQWYEALGFHFYCHFATKKDNLNVMKMCFV